jgi:hypothetical protein
MLEIRGDNALFPIANPLFLPDGTPQIAVCLLSAQPRFCGLHNPHADRFEAR